MSALVRKFRNLEHYNVIVICGETVEYDEFKRRYIAPSMPGKNIKELLPYIFDEVFYATAEVDREGREVFQLHTNKNPGRPGKSRSGKLEAIEQPNLTAIRAKILGSN